MKRVVAMHDVLAQEGPEPDIDLHFIPRLEHDDVVTALLFKARDLAVAQEDPEFFQVNVDRDAPSLLRHS